MADILGATSRQMYDMTYRLINQDAQVTTTKGSWRCRLGEVTWSRKDNDGTVSLIAGDTSPGGVVVKYSEIKSIQLL